MADARRGSLSLGAYLSGAVIGERVRVGDYSVQLHPEHGAVVKPARPDQRPGPRPRESGTIGPPGALPLLLGRADVLEILGGTLASGAPVEVVGEEGAGKTALLCHIAAQRAESLGGLLYLRAAGQPGEDVLQDLFEGLYECEDPTVPRAAELARLLRDRRALIVLDDAELSRGELGRVMSLAPQCSFAIGGLERRVWGTGRSMALGGLDEESCLAMAERELSRELTDRERASLGRLALALGGHPLRMVQAAHLLLERRGAGADRSASQGSPRDQFDDVMAQSLERDEEAVIGPLAAVPGLALGAPQLADITGIRDASRLLASLQVRGVVRAEGQAYRLAEGLRASLGRRGELGAWRARALESIAQGDSVEALAAPATLALIDAAARDGDSRLVVQLARKADLPLALGRRWGAWRESLERALAAARELGDRPTEAWALHQLGSRAASLGGLHDGTGFLNEALALREGLGDGEGVRLTRHNLEALEQGGATESAPAPAALSGPAPPEPSASAPPEPSAPAPATPSEPAPRAPAPPRITWPPATPPPATPPLTPQRPGPPSRSRWRPPAPSTSGLSLPPLKPLIGALLAVVLLVVIVRACSGGDDESGAPTSPGARSFKSSPKDSRGRRAGAAAKKLPVLPAVIEPRALAFSAALVRLSKPKLVREANEAGARIELGRARLEGRDRRDFVLIDGCKNAALSRGAACQVAVSFVPKRRKGADAHTRQGVLILTDGRGGRPRIPLTGSITAP